MSLETASKTHIPHTDLSSVFEWMPACAMVVDANGCILEANKKAIGFFGAKCKTEFHQKIRNIRDVLIDQPSTPFQPITTPGKTTKKDLLIRRSNQSITAIRLSACQFPSNNTLYLLQFHELHARELHQLREFSQTFRRESQKLKPYLNKPGKDLFEQLSFNKLHRPEIHSKSHPKIRNEFGNSLLNEKLSTRFPALTENDLALCELLHMQLSVNEISTLTGRTSNCLRVSIHRILQKTNLDSKRSLCCMLNNILSDQP